MTWIGQHIQTLYDLLRVFVWLETSFISHGNKKKKYSKRNRVSRLNHDNLQATVSPSRSKHSNLELSIWPTP